MTAWQDENVENDIASGGKGIEINEGDKKNGLDSELILVLIAAALRDPEYHGSSFPVKRQMSKVSSMDFESD